MHEQHWVYRPLLTVRRFRRHFGLAKGINQSCVRGSEDMFGSEQHLANRHKPTTTK